MKLLAVLVTLGATLFALENIKISQAQQNDLGVKTQNVKAVDFVGYGPYSGLVVLDKKDVMYISSNIESIIDKIHVRELDHVKKGQKLITIKSNALLSAQQDYIEAILEQENADANYERNVKLQAKGIISSKKLLESQKIKRSNDLKVNLTSSKLLTNGFTKVLLRQLKKTSKPIYEITKYAQKSGVVHQVNVNVGEYVSAEHKLIEIYADGKRFIEITVPVKNINNISLNDTVEFSGFSAKVSAIGNSVNANSQSIIVRATIDDAKNILINRIYETTINKKISQAYKIKKSALVYSESKSLVFKKVASGFDIVAAKVIYEGPVCYVVTAELEDGEALAVSSTSALLSAMDSDDE